MSKTHISLLSRREFLKRTGVATVAACFLGGVPSVARASEGHGADDNGWGILIDVSRCQGCDSCALACREANNFPVKKDPPRKLDSETYSFVDVREVVTKNGASEQRFVKRQCMHCLDAACVSACPAAAMHKTELGPVEWRGNRCLGCRYCMMGCPFGVPRFEWNEGLDPKISKCWMCYERLEEGQKPACVEACPTGAIRFGQRKQLLAQAHALIASEPDRYVDHVFGEFEVGGTSMLYISDVPFEQLGFPVGLPRIAPPEQTEKIMTKLPFVIGGLAVALSGTTVVTHRHGDKETEA